MKSLPAWLQCLSVADLAPEAFQLGAEARLLQNAEDLGAFILDQRAIIRDRGFTGTVAAARYSDVMDASLGRMLSLAQESVGEHAASYSGVAILATGGYGRRELAPFSDIDVTFVPAREDDPAIDQLVRTLFQLLMDSLVRKAQLKVGYAYRATRDCGSLELQTQTSLIESRYVAGDYTLFSDFKDELRRQINPARFVFDKAWERSSVRESAGGILYRVEPDLKNGPGGLREIHTAAWLAQVRFGVWSSAIWEDLIDRDVVSSRDVERLFEALEFIHSIRNALHWRSGKQNDLLMMAQQGDIAQTLGFEPTEGRTPAQQLMTAYFQSAERVSAVAHRVINWVLESRLELSEGLYCIRRRIECSSPELFLSRPSHLVRVFQLGQSLGAALAPGLEALVRAAVEGGNLQPDRECGPIFRQILEYPERVWSTVLSMAELGILGWLIPEFAPLMTLVPLDSSHELTVGYHSLEVLRRLEALRSESSPAAEVFSHLDNPATLYLAALLHDVGKGMPGRGHSELGAPVAPVVGIRLELPPQETAKVEFLVRHHLLMSEISRFRDLTREDSIKQLTSVVSEQELLDLLFLLTQADGLSVGPGAWTAVQGRFLENLYDRGSAALAHPQAEPREADLERYQRKVTRALTELNLSHDEVAEHTRLMPASYLLNTPSEMMALHIEMVRKLLDAGKPVVEFRDDRAGQFTELILCTFDDPVPGLFNKVAGCLWAEDIVVHSAQVFTREGTQRIAIDTLWVDYSGHALDARRKRRLESSLTGVLAGATDVGSLLIARGKSADLETPLREPEVWTSRTDDHMICEIRVGSQRGLLYRITRAISELGWNIQSARITGGRTARIRDVFYISHPDGADPLAAAALLRDQMLATTSD